MDVVDLAERDPDEVRALVGAAFGRQRTAEFWRWKHEDGPWGPSIGVGAVDGGALLGVRLLLPWRLVVDGVPRLAHRAVDAASSPAAQGRGVFSALNRHLMDTVPGATGSIGFFSTPNEQSRGAYRRLGWELLGPVGHRYVPVAPLPRRAAVEAVDPAALVPPAPPADRVGTDWDEQAWRWRVDERSTERYRAARTAAGDAALVYRVTSRKGARLVVVVHGWGEPRARRALAGGVAARERAVLCLEPSGPGAADGLRGPGLRRGGSLLTLWDPAGSALADVGRWWCTFADLERVL